MRGVRSFLWLSVVLLLIAGCSGNDNDTDYDTLMQKGKDAYINDQFEQSVEYFKEAKRLRPTSEANDYLNRAIAKSKELRTSDSSASRSNELRSSDSAAERLQDDDAAATSENPLTEEELLERFRVDVNSFLMEEGSTMRILNWTDFGDAAPNSYSAKMGDSSVAVHFGPNGIDTASVMQSSNDEVSSDFFRLARSVVRYLNPTGDSRSIVDELYGNLQIQPEQTNTWMSDYKIQDGLIRMIVMDFSDMKVTKDMKSYMHQIVIQLTPASSANEFTGAEKEIASFMSDYGYKSIEAVNASDFSIVEPFIDPSGDVYNEQSSYILYLKKKGITEELLSYEVEDVMKKADDRYEVTTKESYTIYYGDGSVKNKTFRSIHLVVADLDDFGWKVNKLIETKELQD
ncbi:hypothetical protein [Paenibacillus sp. NPDC058071]|uniref:TcaA NTF2-like domain-containing protein n=1 Tax=Paenibacillus sp. NPDC058071 TaxID=3346326 RepID=UPI0036DD2B7D